MLTFGHILRYTPAAVVGLLIVAWIVLTCSSVGYKSDYFVIGGQSSSLGVVFTSDESVIVGKSGWSFQVPRFRIRNLIGEFGGAVDRFHGDNILISGHLPIPLLITTLLPLAIGPFIAFRFRLWHYFSYTAVVALELAYYLRWQQ